MRRTVRTRRRDPSTCLIVGCGLIGGSIASALRRVTPKRRIVGVDRLAGPQDDRTGAFDRLAEARALRHLLVEEAPELIVVAVPLDACAAVLAEIAGLSLTLPAKERPLVLDVGSVKGQLMAERGPSCPRFIGGHPMAGREVSGLEHARPDLFDGATFVLCPGDETPARDLTLARAFVRSLGARPLVLPAALHDEIVALTSHLPHLVAWALMHTATTFQPTSSSPSPSKGSRSPDPLALVWQLCAGSWRDATRVAASSPAIWSPILQHNRTAIVAQLDRFLEVLSSLRTSLDQGHEVLAGSPPRARGRTRGFRVDAVRLARLRRALDPNTMR